MHARPCFHSWSQCLAIHLCFPRGALSRAVGALFIFLLFPLPLSLRLCLYRSGCTHGFYLPDRRGEAIGDPATLGLGGTLDGGLGAPDVSTTRVRIFFARRVRTFSSSSDDAHVPVDSWQTCPFAFASCACAPYDGACLIPTPSLGGGGGGTPEAKESARRTRWRRGSCAIPPPVLPTLLLNIELEESVEAERRSARGRRPIARPMFRESGADESEERLLFSVVELGVDGLRSVGTSEERGGDSERRFSSETR